MEKPKTSDFSVKPEKPVRCEPVVEDLSSNSAKLQQEGGRLAKVSSSKLATVLSVRQTMEKAEEGIGDVPAVEKPEEAVKQWVQPAAEKPVGAIR